MSGGGVRCGRAHDTSWRGTREATRGGYTLAMSEILGLLALLLIAGALLLVLLTWVVIREALRPPRHTAGYAVARSLPIDPGELGLEFESWALDRPDGAQLPVWEILGDGAPDGTAVLVHGWGFSRIDMLERVETWRRWCARIILYDRRGHGEASGPGAAGLSRLGHGEEIDLLALLEQLGDGRFILVGHSRGAMISLAAAARDDPIAQRIAGVVADSPSGDLPQALRGRLRASGYPARPVTDLAILALRLRGIRPRPLRDIVSRVPCPVLCFHGTDDPIAPIARIEAMMRAVPAGRFVPVAGAGHFDVHTRDPDAHEQALRAFLMDA